MGISRRKSSWSFWKRLTSFNMRIKGTKHTCGRFLLPPIQVIIPNGPGTLVNSERPMFIIVILYPCLLRSGMQSGIAEMKADFRLELKEQHLKPPARHQDEMGYWTLFHRRHCGYAHCDPQGQWQKGQDVDNIVGTFQKSISQATRGYGCVMFGHGLKW